MSAAAVDYWEQLRIPERAVTKRGQCPEGDGWKLIHAWANPTDGALWLWQR